MLVPEQEEPRKTKQKKLVDFLGGSIFLAVRQKEIKKYITQTNQRKEGKFQIMDFKKELEQLTLEPDI
jgi:hypothetical protein